MKNILVVFFFPLFIWGQNLVPNPSFEDQLYCTDAIFSSLGGGVLQDWYNPNTCTPDYYNACWMTPPPKNWHYQIADGDGFIGLAIYDPNGSNIRDYAACKLLDTLKAEQFYEISFYARIKAGHSRFASNNLGIHLSDTALHANNPYLFNYNNPPLLDAQVKNFNNEIISDSANWTLVRGLYQAQGGETWLTIGNFNSDAETMQGMEYTDGVTPGTYFVIDMVSVIPLDSIAEGMPAVAGPDQTIYIQDSAFIGQKISNMPANWFTLEGVPVASNTAGVYVSPQQTTTYVVTQTLNGVFSSDTVTVFVIGLGLEEQSQSRFSVFPVPNKGTFTVKGAFTAGTSIQVVSQEGKTIYRQDVQSAEKEVVINKNISAGSYMLVLTDQTGAVLLRKRMEIVE